MANLMRKTCTKRIRIGLVL